jgi:23S rRNA (adenine2030-N6)-methyltransferase
MNYRHSFHAGNFADLVKHALVLWLVETLRPAAVIDTHAGAGLYDLAGDAARSKEAEAGVARLMTAEGRPPLLAALAARVAAFNPDGGVRYYPGSPLLIAEALGPTNRYVGFELNPPVRELLSEALTKRATAEAREGDGYAAAASMLGQGPSLVLIDPPFERPDDYIRAAETALAIRRRDPKAVVAIWTPLKDLETFDGFIRRLEGRAGPTLVAEARLRPLTNPMKMNGCAMVVVNPPQGTQAAAREICDWVVSALGEPGGRAEVWTF